MSSLINPLKKIIAWSALFLALFYSGKLIFSAQKSIQKNKQNQHQITAFMKNVVDTQMNAQGQVMRRLTSPYVTHFPNQITKLLLPHFTFYSQTSKPFEIWSNYGKAYNGFEKVVLWHHVKLLREPSKTKPKLTGKTDSITVYPKSKVFDTTKPVELTQNQSVVHSVGMRGNMLNGEVELLSKVRSVYVLSQK